MSDLVTYYLEMIDREDLRAKAGPPSFGVSILAVPEPDLNRQFYQQVGGDWQWIDRLKWSEAQWLEYVNRPAMTTGLSPWMDNPSAISSWWLRRMGIWKSYS